MIDKKINICIRGELNDNPIYAAVSFEQYKQIILILAEAQHQDYYKVRFDRLMDNRMKEPL